jgi:hypothetical protein
MRLRSAMAFVFDLCGRKCLIVGLSQDRCGVCAIGRKLPKDVVGTSPVPEGSRRRGLA